MVTHKCPNSRVCEVCLTRENFQDNGCTDVSCSLCEPNHMRTAENTNHFFCLKMLFFFHLTMRQLDGIFYSLIFSNWCGSQYSHDTSYFWEYFNIFFSLLIDVVVFSWYFAYFFFAHFTSWRRGPNKISKGLKHP